jgi:hypothetical protein
VPSCGREHGGFAAFFLLTLTLLLLLLLVEDINWKEYAVFAVLLCYGLKVG